MSFLNMYIIICVICLINRKSNTLEKHSAVWGKFDGKEREVWLTERGRDR